MPCRSDYLEPNAREIESRRVARLLLYVIPLVENISATGRVFDALRVIAGNEYGDTSTLDHYTEQLCIRCKMMTEEQRKRIMYDGKSKDARALADWWEEHQAADAKREARELAEKKRATLRETALAKLTPKEREALGL